MPHTITMRMTPIVFETKRRFSRFLHSAQQKIEQFGKGKIPKKKKMGKQNEVQKSKQDKNGRKERKKNW